MWFGGHAEIMSKLMKLERKLDALDGKLNRILKMDPDKIKTDIIQVVTENITDSKEDSLSRIKAAVERVLDEEPK